MGRRMGRRSMGRRMGKRMGRWGRSRRRIEGYRGRIEWQRGEAGMLTEWERADMREERERERGGREGWSSAQRV